MMEDDDKELIFAVTYALAFKAHLPKPRKGHRSAPMGDYDPAAKAILDHLRLCRYQITRASGSTTE